MRLLVVGAGAVGSLLAATASLGGATVTVVRRSAVGHGAETRREDLVLVGPDGARATTSVEVAASPASIPTADVVILAVKQYDLSEAVESVRSLSGAAVVTVQNGIGAEEAVMAAGPSAGIVAASLTASVDRAPDGVIRWLRRGGLGLAAVSGDVEPIGRELAGVIAAGGLPTRWIENATAMKWSKLLANLVGNATSAVLDMSPAFIYRDPRLFRIEREQLLEALAVMGALDVEPIDLPGARASLLARAVRLPWPVAQLALRTVVGGARGGKAPSLQLAVRAGGRTEIEWLNGAVARTAAAHGLDAPVNARLVRIVEEAASDPDRRAFFAKNPGRLVAAVGPS